MTGLLLVILLGCRSGRTVPAHEAQSLSDTTASPPAQFDGPRAYSILLKQTSMGPRNPGSAGHDACLSYVLAEASELADTVLQQRFEQFTSTGKRIEGTNIIARFLPSWSDRLLLSAHWDTRPWADQDSDTSKRHDPFLGANDGASGVAVLLEVARALSNHPPPLGVDLVFFDLEDMGHSGDFESWCLGSTYFAAHLPEGASYRFGINIDMVGDKELEIPREVNSTTFAPGIVDMVFATAERLRLYEFVNEDGDEVYDDHIPLNRAHIPCIDLIDFRYPDLSNTYWHTTADTPDKCSPESLSAVGTLLLTVTYAQRSNP